MSQQAIYLLTEEQIKELNLSTLFPEIKPLVIIPNTGDNANGADHITYTKLLLCTQTRYPYNFEDTKAENMGIEEIMAKYCRKGKEPDNEPFKDYLDDVMDQEMWEYEEIPLNTKKIPMILSFGQPIIPKRKK